MKDLQSLQGYVNAKIAVLVEGPLFGRIGRLEDRIKKLEADSKK